MDGKPLALAVTGLLCMYVYVCVCVCYLPLIDRRHPDECPLSLVVRGWLCAVLRYFVADMRQDKRNKTLARLHFGTAHEEARDGTR